MARETQSRRRGGQAASKAPKERTFVAMELPPLEEAGAAGDWLDGAEELELSPAAPPSSPRGDIPKAFPALDPERPEGLAAAPASPAAQGDRSAAGPVREVQFPLLGAVTDKEPGARAPVLTPSMSGGDPPSGLFVLPPDGSWRGALRLRGAQLAIRVDPAAGLALHQPMIAVLQLPNNSYVQLYTWVECLAPDSTLLVGVPDPGGLAELRQLLEWRPRRRQHRQRRREDRA